MLAIAGHLTAVAALVAAHPPLLADDPLQIIHDPIGWVQNWLWEAIFGKDQVQGSGWLGNLFATTFFYTGLDAPIDCATTTGSCIYFGMWKALAAGSDIVVALALTLRMVKVLFDRSKQVGVTQWLVADVLIRGFLTVAAVQLSYFLLAFAMHASLVLGDALFSATVNAGGQQGMADQVTGAFAIISAPLAQILFGLTIVYLMVLIAASRVAMLFAIAVGPLVIPIYAYSEHSDLIAWWLRILGQGLLVPLVAGPLLGVALMSVHTVQGTPGAGSTIGALIAIGAVWFVGHAIHTLLNYLFHGHRGVFEGIGLATAAVMLVPRHIQDTHTIRRSLLGK